MMHLSDPGTGYSVNHSQDWSGVAHVSYGAPGSRLTIDVDGRSLLTGRVRRWSGGAPADCPSAFSRDEWCVLARVVAVAVADFLSSRVVAFGEAMGVPE